MSAAGQASVKKAVVNMSRLADWLKANRPSCDRMTLSKDDWKSIMNYQEVGAAFGVRYTAPPTFKGFFLFCSGDPS